MCTSYKYLLLALQVFLVSLGPCFAQEAEPEANVGSSPFVQLYVAAVFPNAMGSNFLSEAYDLNSGFNAELLLFLKERYFMGYQHVFTTANVENTALVGLFDRSNIQHHYLLGGYSFLPRSSKIGFNVGLGMGYVRYRNFKEDTRFFEDGFSVMANARFSYRLSAVVGLQGGLQYASDFLNTKTAPELESFFNNAQTLYFSVGVVLYTGR